MEKSGNDKAMMENGLRGRFGIYSFSGEKISRYLSEDVCQKLSKTSEGGESLPDEIASSLADGMMRWALDNGATHYTHWFQPLNGATAEKHDSFLSGKDGDGHAILHFSGKELIKGEPDASSFPNGGLRATFEARGYTAYDPTSPAFIIKEGESAVLYIPTAFCSYTNEALDEKTPLLRSMDYVSKQAIRVLRLLGDEESSRVISYCGPEQEYFLLDESQFAKRKDLAYCGHTLFGAKPPKGQELEDHYFGPINNRVASFMAEVNEALWSLGVLSKTEHNEVAPCQEELATIYAPSNISADQNQLVMMLLKKIAKKHGLVCLLDEKPFQGINGSGKHNNFSLSTDKGVNLFARDCPYFPVFLSAMIEGIDEYGEELFASCCSYSNDLRLGGEEAPPSIISAFIGEDNEALVERLLQRKEGEKRERGIIDTGVKTLPYIYKDAGDRNRTSPFAYNGNKFEFRMVGSSAPIAESSTALNTILGRALSDFASALEASPNPDKKEAAAELLVEKLKKHKRILYSGDGYSKEWENEAKRRGLPHLHNAVEGIASLESQKAKDLYGKANVLSERELQSRVEVKYAEYGNKATLDAKTMVHMASKLFLPACLSYSKRLLEQLNLPSGPKPSCLADLAKKLSSKIDEAYQANEKLKQSLEEANAKKGRDLAYFAASRLRLDMGRLRQAIDELELLVDKREWPVPSYGDLLFHTA